MRAVIGVDFDNTIVSYDDLLSLVAAERELLSPESLHDKKSIRDGIRSLPDGEIEWQKLQAEVYGPRIGEARLIPGVGEFFRLCRQNSVAVFVISHKSEYAAQDATGTNLRIAAFDWMNRHELFDTVKTGLTPRQIFFESTRNEKLARIRQMRCTHFIDDMEETFLEKMFPENVERILYRPAGGADTRFRIVAGWKEVIDHFFPSAA